MPKNPARGIVLRRASYWYNETIKGKRKWYNLHTAKFAEAIKKVEAMRVSPVVGSDAPLADEIARFTAYKLAMDEFTRNSADKATTILKAFAREHPDATLASLSPAQLQLWYERLREDREESTAQSYVMTVRSFLQWAVDVERIRIDNPAAKVKLAQLPKRARKRFATKADRDKLIEHAPNDDLRFILFAGFHAGFRRNEISEAHASWFDLGARLIHVTRTETFRPKDREDRTIPMTAQFHAFLARYLKGKNGFALRPDVTHGKFRYRYDFRRPFTDYLKKMSMEWVTAHLMRRSFASILASSGVSIYKIAKWLGDDVRVTQDHYAHLIPADEDIELLS